MQPPAPRTNRLFRAALFGLAMGLFAGAGLLTYGAIESRNPDCTDYSASECEMVKELGALHARTQALSALALALIGAATILVARGRKTE